MNHTSACLLAAAKPKKKKKKKNSFRDSMQPGSRVLCRPALLLVMEKRENRRFDKREANTANVAYEGTCRFMEEKTYKTKPYYREMRTDDNRRRLINRKLASNNRRDQREATKGWLTAKNFEVGGVVG